MTTSTTLRYIVALAPIEGKPLEWWTGELKPMGEPEGTASYTMAFAFESEARAYDAAITARVPAGFLVRPMAVTRLIDKPQQQPSRRAS